MPSTLLSIKSYWVEYRHFCYNVIHTFLKKKSPIQQYFVLKIPGLTGGHHVRRRQLNETLEPEQLAPKPTTWTAQTDSSSTEPNAAQEVVQCRRQGTTMLAGGHWDKGKEKGAVSKWGCPEGSTEEVQPAESQRGTDVCVRVPLGEAVQWRGALFQFS